MRSADAVGAKGIILIDDCTDPYSVEAVRASMGAIFNVEIVQCNQVDFLDFTQGWISNQGQIIGTALPASVDYRDADYSGALMILMGNEQAGLPPALTQACTQLIRLPMLGRSDSLNLAVATGVTLYEALRNRR
jgi:TrmH family RNA methyltransferase